MRRLICCNQHTIESYLENLNMASSEELEVFKALRSAQDRYDYFLMAAAGAAVAFALTQTREEALSLSHIPLGGALLCWGISFFFGCRHLLLVNDALWWNGQMLMVRSGNHPVSGQNIYAIQIAAEYFKKVHHQISDKAGRFANWQFILFIVGGIFYVAWHVLEMAMRAKLITI